MFLPLPTKRCIALNDMTIPWPPSQSIRLGVDVAGNIHVGLGEGIAACAELIPDASSASLRDLGGPVPVLLNENEVIGRILLRPGDEISIGSWRWCVPSSTPPISSRPAPVRPQGGGTKAAIGLRIDADNISYHVDLRAFRTPSRRLQLLKDVGLTIMPGEFVGIVGASGSGKSTLLRALNGDYTPQSGSVRHNGESVASFLAKNPGRLAYLPQELILHNELTPRQALGYTARLRGIDDDDDVVEDVLHRVGLQEHAEKRIGNLSGGQKKRAGLAAELLSEPDALFLDEATSGLDPLGEKEMMELFRQLADSGMTVVCITHFPGQLGLCDRILAVDKGKLVLDGAPGEILDQLEIPSFEDIYTRLTTLPPVTRRTPPPIVTDKSKTHMWTFTPPPAMEQVRILTRRYLSIILRDRKTVLLYIIQPPVIAALIGATFGNIVTGFAERHASDVKQVGFLMLLAILWCASMNGVREIIKERSLFAHERRFGQDPAAYLASKFFPLAVVGVGQAVILALTLAFITGFAAAGPMGLVIAMLVGLAGTALGLAVSAAVLSSERAMTVLPVILIGEAVYSGGLANMTGINKAAAMLLASSYWGLEGLKSLLPTNLLYATFPSAVGHYQPPILGVPYPYALDAAMLLFQTAALLVAAWLFVRRIRA